VNGFGPMDSFGLEDGFDIAMV
jgi:hypothetical protein